MASQLPINEESDQFISRSQPHLCRRKSRFRLHENRQAPAIQNPKCVFVVDVVAEICHRYPGIEILKKVTDSLTLAGRTQAELNPLIKFRQRQVRAGSHGLQCPVSARADCQDLGRVQTSPVHSDSSELDLDMRAQTLLLQTQLRFPERLKRFVANIDLFVPAVRV